MREILFRGQTRKNGEKVRMGDGQKLPGHWVYGGVLQGAGSHSIIYGGENVNDPAENLDKWCVHTDTLGQFTGLTDKNGKKIFEGDIIKNEYEDGKYQKFKIFYNAKTLQWEVMNKYGMRGILHNVIGNMEVLGNIHDNPELLENP